MGGMGGWCGREVQEGGVIGIHIADSLHCMAETQHCKAIILQLKKKKKERKKRVEEK